jgi:oxalate---CoA ligase
MNTLYSLHKLFAALAETSPLALAISAPSRPNLTFQALSKLIEANHLKLRQLGIDRGDRVVLIAPVNSPETAVISLAIAASATLIPLDPNLSTVELKNRLEQLNPKVIINFANYLLPALTFDDRLPIPTLQASPDWEQAAGTFQLNGTTSFVPSQDDWAEPEDDALIVMTSGSTGIPKLVHMTQDALCYSCLEASQLLQLDDRDICLNVLSLFHVHGLITNFILPLLAGGKVAFYGNFEPDYFLDWLVDSQATWYSDDSFSYSQRDFRSSIDSQKSRVAIRAFWLGSR